MHTIRPSRSNGTSHFVLATAVLLSCFALFYLDHETRSVSDLFKPGNLFALIIYFTPAFLICSLLFQVLIRKYALMKSLAVSLFIGIPAGFTLVIVLMLLLRNYRHF